MYDAFTFEYINEYQTNVNVRPTAMILKKSGILLVSFSNGTLEHFSFSKRLATIGPVVFGMNNSFTVPGAREIY